MPRYEYRCPFCERRFECSQPVDAREWAMCAVCQEPAPKVPSAPSIRFVGPGWYATEYQKKDGGE